MSADVIYYPLENERKETRCSSVDGEQYDSNYQLLKGFRISEYEIQTSSGVFSRLENLTKYETYVKDAEERKRKNMYNFYQRPMLDWKLECHQDDGALLKKALLSMNQI